MKKIIRYCVLEEEHFGDNVFLCHRPHTFGNPFIYDKTSKFKNLVKVSSLEECLKFYDIYFDRSINENPEFKKEWERLVKAYYDNDVIYFGCYCKLDKPCHTDIIAEKLKQYIIKENVRKLLEKKNRKN